MKETLFCLLYGFLNNIFVLLFYCKNIVYNTYNIKYVNLLLTSSVRAISKLIYGFSVAWQEAEGLVPQPYNAEGSTAHCKMITTISLVNIHHHAWLYIFFSFFLFLHSFLFFLTMRTFKIHRTLWKTIISQRFSHRSESLGPHTSGSPVWGSDIGKRSPQSI